jgi:hypothetical protein
MKNSSIFKQATAALLLAAAMTLPFGCVKDTPKIGGEEPGTEEPGTEESVGVNFKIQNTIDWEWVTTVQGMAPLKVHFLADLQGKKVVFLWVKLTSTAMEHTTFQGKAIPSPLQQAIPTPKREPIPPKRG